MSTLPINRQSIADDGGPVDAKNYARAMLNILEDGAEERARLTDAQRAVLNILEDGAEEKAQLADAQRAAFNILEDGAEERARQTDAQRAAFNILEDGAEEKAQLADAQRAVLNILEDDLDLERKIEQANIELRVEVAERARVEIGLRRAKAVTDAANKELEAFAYSVSHDLRTPLRGMAGFSQILIDDFGPQLPLEAQQHLRRIQRAATTMGELIDGMLTLSRISRGELRHENVDLSALAVHVLDELRRSQPERQVECAVAEGLQVSGDARLLRILLENILGNAWKFTGRGATPRIEFGTVSTGAEQAFYVRDNGAGFDMAYADKLFGAFQRLHTADEFPGTGIGLATAQRIVNRHGGRIWAESGVGKGATFYFTI